MIKSDAVIGIKWSALSQLFHEGMQWVTSIILARFLAVSDFGLFSMALVFVGFATLFKDLGTSSAVIQRKDISDELLSSIFWVNIILGISIVAVFFLISPVVASFYQEIRIIPLMKILSLTFLISSIGSIQQAILERNLGFNKIACLETIATIFGAIVGIGGALLGHGVWSLVYRTFAVATVTTVLLWYYSTWRPKFIFHSNVTCRISSCIR